MISSSELSENRPSVVDAMQACEKNSSAKEDSAHNMRLLPEGYKPGEHDVLCGRGRKCFNHAGNVKFRAIVQSFLPQYSKAVAKLEKSYILSDVVEQVRKSSGVGGFIKKDPDTGRWYEVGDFLAREKTSQAFRDVLHDKYKSSNTAKKKRRQEEQAEKLFRAHSNRSLGGNSLDASSVHSVGSSTTGGGGGGGDGYMLSDTKLMRMERSGLERSDSILNLGDEEDEPQHDDLLGGLDQEIANIGSRPRTFNRQRSLRSVLDIDTNRRAVMTSSKSGTSSFYNRSSCPNLFAPPQRTHSGSAPPISQIEIIQEEGLGGMHMPPPIETLEVPVPNDLDSFGTSATAEATVVSTSSSNAGAVAQAQQQQPTGGNWFHHSQPNLFGDAPPVNPQGGQRSSFARQPPNRMMRRPHRANSGQGSVGNLAGVQQRIDNLGLSDSSHGKPTFALGLDGSNHGKPFGDSPQGGGSARLKRGGSLRNLMSSGSQRNLMSSNSQRNLMSGGQDNEEGDRSFLPQGLQQQHQPLPVSLMSDTSQLGNNSDTGGSIGSASASGSVNDDDSDADLMARLEALENTGFGMGVIDENPFEPVPLRE